ncbi:hypothetical protein [Streptomyces cadmiisoli]|uniref:hypothetical protein n=1 Tax=Streptomyces cadmiisoli TaxID=2184053 RepID=UPI003D71A1A6
MTAVLPRTIRAVDTDRLLLLEEEAARLGLSQRLPVDWLREHAQAAAVHYLFPVRWSIGSVIGRKCHRSGGASCCSRSGPVRRC